MASNANDSPRLKMHFARAGQASQGRWPAKRPLVDENNSPSGWDLGWSPGGVGLPLIAPNLDGPNTSNGYHLDRPNAKRWSKAFLEAAGPEIRFCLEKHGAGS
jgi:hypothetical protein